MGKKCFVYLIIVLIVCLSGSIYGGIPAQERTALIALYNATNGGSWADNGGWKTLPLDTDGFAMPGTEGTWYGINVYSNQVIGIDLRSNQLTGSIPAELGNLSHLKNLYLGSNQVGGSIPTELGNLSNLVCLDLQCNQFSGSIPAKLGNLSNLQALHLWSNQLSGSIPSELGNLSKLAYLDLESNQLSGSIPPELGNLSNLYRLGLELNQLSGSIPSELGNLSNLRWLKLQSNQLIGSIPPELGNLSNLESLVLYSNQLSGGIPPEVGNLSNLQELFLSYNQLSGVIPPKIGNLSNLQGLFLMDNQLNGSIPSELGNLSKLAYLDLESNQLSGSIPPELGNLNNLYRLGLELNQLSGSIPSELGNLSNLRWFNLQSNQLTGNLPPELGNLSNLESLVLYSNQLNGSIPPELGNLSNLYSLWLNYNQLSGSIPPELGNLGNLRALGLDLNQVSGSIPSELGNLGNLQYLDLKSNQLSGTIPPELGNLSNLTRLGLDSNQLSGSIPKELGNLSSVIWFNLQSNQLTGSLPKELGNLNNLESLVLYSNQLSGSIPPELGNLGNLRALGLDLNQVSGSIPSELGNLGNLQYLDLKSNQLSGTIPPELGNLSNLTRLGLDSNQLSGSIPKELGNLSNVIWFNLQSNQLTGSIPPELGNLDNLEYLRLNNNKLGDAIPTNLMNLKNLIALNIRYNCLYANDPPLIVWLDSYDPDWESYQDECTPPTPTYTLYVNSTPETGIDITVIPTDNFGYGDGSTNFTRTYDLGTIVTLEAPSSFNGSDFVKWSVDGIDNTNRNIQVTMENDHTAAAYYETTIPPEIRVNRKRLNLGYVIGSNNLPIETFSISNRGGGTLNWSVSSESQWMVLSPISGTNDGVVKVTIDPVRLTPGKYEGIIEVSDPFATNSPVEVVVKLQVKDKSKVSPPFGDFATPIDSSTVRSSIAVTGWALGDTGIESVKIYRGEGSNLVYIGDAVFVEGARPDVEAAYPDYPMNYKAGWGYMMLTNFLPNGGNGTYKIHAIATDKEGQTTTLGIKTITGDNANAVKPFGAIDTPTQGGTASGSSFINWGWVLTPHPNSIPTDGSTIKLWVDGVNLGHPTYNIYRPDIANLFPNYANSNGAAGYFYLDTTAYDNGVHTIQWTATDNAGNTDGIGSRYFTIQNTGSASNQRSLVDEELSPISIAEPVRVRKGYNEDIELQEIYPDDSGVLNIEIKELERMEIHLDGNRTEVEAKVKVEKKEKGYLEFFTGFLVIDDRIRPLPVGSDLDTRNGVFSWQPGPGFYGTYEFVFIKADGSDRRKVGVRVKILPKYSGSLE